MTESPYKRIGGTPTVRRVVDRLYFWIFRDDELYLTYFQNIDLPALKAHMVSLISHALGGPKEYQGHELVEVHSPLNITSEHYDRVCNYVLAGLLVEHAPRDIVQEVDDLLKGLKVSLVRE